MARGLAQGGPVALIDTENASASLYGDRFDFDALNISPPYLTKKYVEAVKDALAGGYKVLVIDSISHQWDGDGGILQRKEETDARGGNHFSNWEPFTKEHNQFRALLLHAPIHIVATMRSKMAYSQEKNGEKSSIKKLGLQPIQRDGMEYEFTVAFDVQMDHRALASKDRTALFGTDLLDLADAGVAKRLLDWLGTAAPDLGPLMIGKEFNGVPLSSEKVTTENILKMIDAVKDKPKYATWVESATMELERRREVVTA